MFHQVRIPKDNLLTRTGDVSAEGKYTSAFKVGALLLLGLFVFNPTFVRFHKKFKAENIPDTSSSSSHFPHRNNPVGWAGLREWDWPRVTKG